MLMSALTTKHQATVPKQVREVLQLAAGDRIQWILDPQGVVRVRKAPTNTELGALEATLVPEWDSADDDEAYAGL
jgi:bifunctional DNA-binding transcriptional regulator/antitoxin component of YhaV-PrlF toxin-antitoxin module